MLKNQWGSVRVYMRNETYWVYIHYKKGPKIRHTLSTPSKAEAMEKAVKILAELDPAIQAKKASLVPLSEAFDRWMGQPHLRDRTRHGYSSLKNFTMKWVNRSGIVNVTDVTPQNFSVWLQSHDWTRLSPTTRKVWLAMIKGMFNYAVSLEILEKSPLQNIRVREKIGMVQGPYSDVQVESILAVADLNEKRLIEFLLATGMDTCDAYRFRRGQVSVSNGVHIIKYHRQKTGRMGIIPIPANMGEEILEGAEQPYHVWDMGKKVKKVLNRAGVKWIDLPDGHRHSANAKQFRHTFAVRMLRRGVSVDDLVKMMGHKDSTMIYKHYAPFIAELETAMIERVAARLHSDVPRTRGPQRA